MGWGGVYKACTRIIGNVIAVEKGDWEVIAEMDERMGANHGLERVGWNIRDMSEGDFS